MAISTSFSEVKDKFNPGYWKDIYEFEKWWLTEISERLGDTNYYTNEEGLEITIPPVNHHPELKEYEVWMEGYAATGESGCAHLVGKTFARNFAQACHIVMCKRFLEWADKENKPSYKQYCTPGRWDYDPRNLSSWGCKLYWSQELASKTYG